MLTPLLSINKESLVNGPVIANKNIQVVVPPITQFDIDTDADDNDCHISPNSPAIQTLRQLPAVGGDGVNSGVISRKRQHETSSPSHDTNIHFRKIIRINEDNQLQQIKKAIERHTDNENDDDDDGDGCIFKVLAQERYGYRKFYKWIKEDMIFEIEKFPNRYNENGFNFDINRMTLNLKSSCKVEKCRFSIPELAQLAADTFHIPIVVCDNVTSNRVYLPITALFSWNPAIILYFENYTLIDWKTHNDVSSLSSIAKLNSRHLPTCERVGWLIGIKNANRCYPK